MISDVKYLRYFSKKGIQILNSTLITNMRVIIRKLGAL